MPNELDTLRDHLIEAINAVSSIVNYIDGHPAYATLQPEADTATDALHDLHDALECLREKR